jgi:hypothetical protein
MKCSVGDLLKVEGTIYCLSDTFSFLSICVLFSIYTQHVSNATNVILINIHLKNYFLLRHMSDQY